MWNEVQDGKNFSRNPSGLLSSRLHKSNEKGQLVDFDTIT